ncbi:unnamed protein product, partial [Candidula unifasciata]
CRQPSQSSSSQAASLSRPSSARNCHRDSAPSLSEVSSVKQASSISSSDQHKPKIQSPKKEGISRKKNFLRNHVKSRNIEQSEMESSPPKERSDKDYKRPSPDREKNHEQDVPFPQSENKTRPLPVPRVKASASPPQQRRDRLGSADFSTSLSVSSSTEDRETPRSLPNLSARQRRRQQMNEFAESKDNPNSARIKLKRAPERTESDKVTRTEKKDLQVEAMDPPRPKPTRQPSIPDSTSSSDEFLKVAEKEGPREIEARRENKEINNLICLLNTTLQMNNTAENSDEEEEERALKPGKKKSESSLPPPQLAQEPTLNHQIHKSVSMPSVETLTDTSRLMQRIRVLHSDCIKGVGYQALKKAYEILNKIDEDEVEPKLVDLLGKEKFDEYAGKIWQLKFCEESLFISS